MNSLKSVDMDVGWIAVAIAVGSTLVLLTYMIEIMDRDRALAFIQQLLRERGR